MAIKRKYPTQPVVGVGGIVIEEGRVLLARRASEFLQGRWSIPGGALELGENISSGIERELREETGLAVRCGRLVEAVERIERDAAGIIKYHFVILDHLCQRLRGRAISSSDVSEVAWVAEGELPEYELDAITDRVIRKAFRMGHEAPGLAERDLDVCL